MSTSKTKRVSGGLVVQTRDASAAGEVLAGKVVTKRAPTTEELHELELAWKVVKHVKSNAIIVARDGRTVGVGAGQMNRLESARIAAWKVASENFESIHNHSAYAELSGSNA